MIQIKRSELKQLAQNRLKDDSIESQNKILVMISTSLSARTSYTVVGEEKELNYENLIALHDRLLNQHPPHSSPFEHTARAMSDEEYYTAVKTVQGLNREKAITRRDLGWCNNLKGFIQYRYIVDNNLSL
ncbi:putative thymidylate synthase [Flavobacterium phage FPSV-S29]|nr:putative thymidylate synthase [Flavobacterium phage FPSV-S29]